MTSESVIDPKTIQAYRETHYSVAAAVPLILRPGVPSPELLDLYRKSGSVASAYITVCNPFSAPFDEHRNGERQQDLANQLRQRGLMFIEGLGQHPSGEWPGEASFLILGLALEAARVLGQAYEQNGILWCGADGVPQLILLR